MNQIPLFSSSPLIRYWGQLVVPDLSRTILQEFLREEGDATLVEVVLAYSPEDTTFLLSHILDKFNERYVNIENTLFNHGKKALDWSCYLEAHNTSAEATLRYEDISRNSIILLGAYSTREYATEAAALTNPSIVKHPDQEDLEAGQVRTLLSLRAVGEGHLSSIAFLEVVLDEVAGAIVSHRPSPQILGEVSADNEVNKESSSYTVVFPSDSKVSQRILYPESYAERRGMEDARFVEIAKADGGREYRATYTAYDGEKIFPRLIVSNDLLEFKVYDLLGPASVNKGMALFPQKINGKWMALTRGDGYRSSVAESVDGIYWDNAKPLSGAQEPWNLAIAGNAGSPHLTDEGWLVITHGVGPLRTYSLGAMLLNRDNPQEVVGTLRGALLTPSKEESIGYVPNVVYSCGNLIVGENLWLPYGASDRSVSLASVNIAELIEEILKK